MPSPTKNGVPSATLELYEKLVAANPGIQRKGATHPYTSRNGQLSCEYVRTLKPQPTKKKT